MVAYINEMREDLRTVAYRVIVVLRRAADSEANG